MRKEVLFAIIMLLLTLTLLPTASVVAPGPKPKEQANVELTGPDIMSDGVETLDISRAGRRVIVGGPAALVGIEWDDFETGHQLGIRIDKRNGKTCIIYTFGTSDFEGKG